VSNDSSFHFWGIEVHVLGCNNKFELCDVVENKCWNLKKTRVHSDIYSHCRNSLPAIHLNEVKHCLGMRQLTAWTAAAWIRKKIGVYICLANVVFSFVSLTPTTLRTLPALCAYYTRLP
jgi:hypothetical protein